MKLYEIVIDMNDSGVGLEAVSFVADPAIERNFLAFKDVQLFKFDSDKHIVTGPSLIPNLKIYRFHPEIGEYEVFFSETTIRQLVEKFFKEGKVNMTTIDHETRPSDEQATLIESYFIDHERGICPGEYKDLPNGTWITSYKVHDEALWNTIKEKRDFKGFSVEVITDLKPVHMSKEETFDEWVESFISERNVRDVIDAREQVILIDRSDKKILCQIKELAVKNGVEVMNVYLPDQEIWRVIPLTEVKDFILTGMELTDWKYELPSFDEIQKDENNVVIKSNIASKESITYAIQNRKIVFISYRDLSGEPCTSSRQVKVCAFGKNKDTNNEQIRVYQLYGATHTESEGWKLLNTKQILSWRVAEEFGSWTDIPSGYVQGDSAMSQIYAEI